MFKRRRFKDDGLNSDNKEEDGKGAVGFEGGGRKERGDGDGAVGLKGKAYEVAGRKTDRWV